MVLLLRFGEVDDIVESDLLPLLKRAIPIIDEIWTSTNKLEVIFQKGSC
jgi:hypothetical protein